MPLWLPEWRRSPTVRISDLTCSPERFHAQDAGKEVYGSVAQCSSGISYTKSCQWARMVTYLISRSATVPGRNRWGFFTPPSAGAFFLAALFARTLRGALEPVCLRAVCLVRAIVVQVRLKVCFTQSK